MVEVVVRSCPECAAYARKLTKPLIRIRMAEHFNYRVQTDLFFLWNLTFVILVDECIRYCICEELPDRTASAWIKDAFHSWIKYFGPMYILASDQEGALISDLVGTA